MDGKYFKKNRCLIEDDIDKLIRDDIFSINEELSVSSEVRHYVKEMMKLISDSLKTRTVYYDVNGGIKRRVSKVTFIYTIDNVNITIDVRFIEFDNLDDRNMSGGIYDLGGRFDANSKTLYLRVPIIGWDSMKGAEINKNDYAGVLSHELEHVHWMLKCGGDVSSDYAYKRYKMVVDVMTKNSTTEDETRLRELAFCLYMCANFERSGFVHGLDGTLRTLQNQDNSHIKTVHSLYDEFRFSMEYTNMRAFKYVLDNIENYRYLSDSNSLFSIWHGSFDSLIKCLKKNYKLLCRGLYRVLYKVSKESDSAMCGPVIFYW